MKRLAVIFGLLSLVTLAAVLAATQPTATGAVNAEEIDHWPDTIGVLTLDCPGLTPGPILVRVSGPTTVKVFLDELDDRDEFDHHKLRTGLEDVPSELIELNLRGRGPGKVRVHITLRDPSKHPFQRSLGYIEENTNAQAGVIEVPGEHPPFQQGGTGSALSFFDVFLEATVRTPNGTIVLHNDGPKQLKTNITHKPPAEQETYGGIDPVELLTEDHQVVCILKTAEHTPDPGSCDLSDFPHVVSRTQDAAGTIWEVQDAECGIFEVRVVDKKPDVTVVGDGPKGCDKGVVTFRTIRDDPNKPPGPHAYARFEVENCIVHNTIRVR